MDFEKKEDERAPLLGAVGGAVSQVSAPPIETEDSKEDTNHHSTENNFIQCHVCKEMIDIRHKKETFVVKCTKCNEATPIRKAPPKKRYIRCSCNCLLICYESAQKIVCPRTNCKKIITIKDIKKPEYSPNEGATIINQQQGRNVPAQNSYLNTSQFPNRPSLPSLRPGNGVGNCFVICAHCGQRFVFNTLSNELARCISCRKLSSVGPEFARTRGIIFLVLFIMFFSVGLGVAFGARSYSDSYLVIALYTVLFAISAIFFIRSIYYLSMKVSYIEQQLRSNAI